MISFSSRLIGDSIIERKERGYTSREVAKAYEDFFFFLNPKIKRPLFYAITKIWLRPLSVFECNTINFYDTNRFVIN